MEWEAPGITLMLPMLVLGDVLYNLYLYMSFIWPNVQTVDSIRSLDINHYIQASYSKLIHYTTCLTPTLYDI